MSDKRHQTISGGKNGHKYQIELTYLQFFDQGHLINEVLNRQRAIVDGQLLTISTPGFKDLGDPVASVEAYIDQLS